MKILTLNCQRAHHKESLIEFLSYVIESNEYDAVFLQELPQDILPIVNDDNEYHYVSDRTITGPNGRVAVILRKDYEILKTDHCLFERQKTEDKEYFFELISVLFRDKDLKKYIFSSLHMPAYLHIYRRIRHLKKVFWRIGELKKENNEDAVVVVGGDWNSIFPYEKYILSYSLSNHFKFEFPKQPTVFAGRIEPGLFWNNFVKKTSSLVKLDFIVDFFLLSSNVKCNIQVIESDVSDHNPVSLTIGD